MEFKNDGYPATLGTVRLDKDKMTVGRLRKFVDAWVAGWRPVPGTGKHEHRNGGQGIVPVETNPKGKSRWGPMDLAGSVYEWNLDWATGYGNPRTDGANTTTEVDSRVLRGGSFRDEASYLRAAYSYSNFADSNWFFTGARCARMP